MPRWCWPVPPITPPSYSRLVAQTLSRSSFFELPDEGHGILGAGCETEIVSQFLNDPTAPINASCIAETPPIHFVGS
jgi:hypothetical protein